MNIGFIVFAIIVISVVMTRYFMFRRRREHLERLSTKFEKDVSDFLATFNPSSFNDFSALDFKIGRFSLVAPFPSRGEGELRYTIYLEEFEADDVITIIHEIVECTIGRVIEKLVDLKKPLYLQRKQEDKFWIRGKKQKYGVEHVATTLSEALDVPHAKLKERLAKEDLNAWLDA